MDVQLIGTRFPRSETCLDVPASHGAQVVEGPLSEVPETRLSRVARCLPTATPCVRLAIDDAGRAGRRGRAQPGPPPSVGARTPRVVLHGTRPARGRRGSAAPGRSPGLFDSWVLWHGTDVVGARQPAEHRAWRDARARTWATGSTTPTCAAASPSRSLEHLVAARARASACTASGRSTMVANLPSQSRAAALRLRGDAGGSRRSSTSTVTGATASCSTWSLHDGPPRS